jgi:hypothetical protein
MATTLPTLSGRAVMTGSAGVGAGNEGGPSCRWSGLSDGVGEGVCEEGADAEGEACVEGGADGLGPDAELAAVQALRHPAVPAARASRKSRRCMGRTFLSTRERQATCVQNIM